MADSTNPLDQIVVGQAQPAVLANELFDAMSPAAIYGRRGRTTTGLTWGYYGGRYNGAAIAHGTILLPASQAAVYIVAYKIDGAVSQSASDTNWNDTDNYERLYLAVTGTASITSYEDYREWIGSSGAGSTSSEQIQDIIGALIVAGSNVSVVYDDAGSPATLTISATGGGSVAAEDVEDIVGALLVAGSGVTINYDDASSPATITISAPGAGVDAEDVQDIVGALIVAGTGVTAVYDDAASPATLTISAPGAGVDAEDVQDIVGALVVAGTGISVTYDDAASPATLTVTATGSGSGGTYTEGSGLPGGSPPPENGSRHFETDLGILYTWSDYAGNWVEL